MAQPGEIKLTNEIRIQCAPESLFDYVSRPDLWHEWHPASKSAVLPRVPLQPGDAFHEIITVTYPFIGISRATDYRVTLSDRANTWEVKGSSSLFDLTIHYDFAPESGATLFRRTLTYSVKGPLAWFEPFVVRPKIKRQSALALRNLKFLVERR